MIAWHDGSLAVSPIPVNKVSMVIGQRVNLINKPAATRPDASDNSMTEATSSNLINFSWSASLPVLETILKMKA